MNAVKSGPFVLPPLPDAENALAPAISAHTLQFHCGKHHWGYVDRLNELVVGSELAALSLEELVRRASAVPESSVFRSAAQAWNHEFYWRSLAPGGGRPRGELKDRIDADFGRYERFAAMFAAAANDHFGSGWAWLVADAGVLRVEALPDVGTPNSRRVTSLLVVDLWEHAYSQEMPGLEHPQQVDLHLGRHLGALVEEQRPAGAARSKKPWCWRLAPVNAPFS